MALRDRVAPPVILWVPLHPDGEGREAGPWSPGDDLDPLPRWVPSGATPSATMSLGARRVNALVMQRIHGDLGSAGQPVQPAARGDANCGAPWLCRISRGGVASASSGPCGLAGPAGADAGNRPAPRSVPGSRGRSPAAASRRDIAARISGIVMPSRPGSSGVPSVCGGPSYQVRLYVGPAAGGV